jgi:hypothetical protein
MSIWPGILVPIIIFFGLVVFLADYITSQAIKGIQKK